MYIESLTIDYHFHGCPDVIEQEKLTTAQIRLVEMPASECMLVLAGPGTGKTHALIRRLVHLVKVQGLSPYNEILVLSFTRAAVGEIRERVNAYLESQEQPGGLVFLNIMTFDSFATRLISAAESNINLSGKSYDARIDIATRVLMDPVTESSNRLSGLKHVIIDEIQDLVSVRARMVQEILQRIGGGFTLLGDPAQAIYDYQVKKPSDRPGAIEFLKWVQSTWSGELHTIEFIENHRVRTEAARVAEKTRLLVLETQNGDPEGYRSIRAVLADLPIAGSYEYIDQDVLKAGQPRKAILCRTNAEVLLVASRLIDQNIPVAFPPLVDEGGLPPWVASMFSDYLRPRIRTDEFAERWMDRIDQEYYLEHDQAWEQLKLIEGTTHPALNMDLIRERARRGVDWSFDSELYLRKDHVLVTTVHRSKGREFDEVCILPPEPRKVRSVRIALEEARVYYVAATRARDEIYQLKRDGLPAITRIRCGSGRWRYVGKHPDGHLWMEAGVPGDILPLSSVDNTFLTEPKMAAQLQSVISKYLCPGMKMSARFQIRKGDPGFLLVAHLPGGGASIPVAAFDAKFASDLTEILKQGVRGSHTYAQSYDHLLLLERYTGVIPIYSQSVYEPYADTGFYLGVRARGMLRL